VNIHFNKVVDTIAGLDIPGFVLLITMATCGWSDAAALTTALATLGAPPGMLGDMPLLDLLTLISQAISEHGFEKIAVAVAKELQRKSRNREDVLGEIQSYPISRDMKVKIRGVVNDTWRE
jgi:hypothetical protein